MKNITISIDSTADMSAEIIKKHNFKVVHLGITIGDKSFIDKDVKPKDIYRAVEVENKVPKTNAGLESDYKALFEEATKDGGEIIHFNIGDKLSATHANTKRAAEGMKGVYVIDSKTLSMGTGIAAIEASKMRDQGMSAEEIAEKALGIVENVNVSFIIKDLKYLHRGGRVSGLKLLGANMLKIRPSLYTNEEGQLVPGKKYKGAFGFAVREYTKDRIVAMQGNTKDTVYVCHTDMDKGIAEQMVADLKAAGFTDIIRLTAGPVITTHCGRNTIGIGFVAV